MNPVFKEYGLKDLLPLKLDIPDEGCTRPNKNMYCFEAGECKNLKEPRSNLLIVSLAAIMDVRESNLQNNYLNKLNEK